MLAHRCIPLIFAGSTHRSIPSSLGSHVSGSQRTFISSASAMVGFIHNVAQVGFGTGTNELYDRFAIRFLYTVPSPWLNPPVSL